jgi:hypothetical protein
MKKTLNERGSEVAPRGFLASGVFCDIKRLGTGKGSNEKRDLALIKSEVLRPSPACSPPSNLRCAGQGVPSEALAAPGAGHRGSIRGTRTPQRRQGAKDALRCRVRRAPTCKFRAN